MPALYTTRPLTLYFYLCRWLGGVPRKIDCLNARWVEPREMLKMLFPPSDRDLIQRIIALGPYYERRLPGGFSETSP
jgi:hypothetical protein